MTSCIPKWLDTLQESLWLLAWLWVWWLELAKIIQVPAQVLLALLKSWCNSETPSRLFPVCQWQAVHWVYLKVNGIKLLDENNQLPAMARSRSNMRSSTMPAGKWEPAQVTSNANKAVADPSVVALIGHFNSGAKLSIPVLNQADLVMVSPQTPILVWPSQGKANKPNVYYPNGKRNYARVVPWPARDFSC